MKNLLATLIGIVWIASASAINISEPQVSTAAYSSISPVSIIDGDAFNGIRLLQNRFRVDYKVEQVTLLFFRDYGSAPVILVQPNGEKLYQDDSATNIDVEWYDDLSYDMIKIDNPMPGPWQVIGDVLPNSKVMVLSDLALVVDPLPNILYAGEILKKTVRLTNNGQAIDQNEFRDVVTLNIHFDSTNNEASQNFALPSTHITQFQDDGKGMDERPNDGVFTGKFNLNLSAGEWLPVFDVETPMFSRQYHHQPVNLLPTPVAMNVDLDKTPDRSGEHTLYVYADSPFIQQKDFVVSGGVQAPNGDIQNFSVTEFDENGTRSVKIPNYLAGVYRVNITLYATTIEDREIVVTVPEYSFVVEHLIQATNPSEGALAATDSENSDIDPVQQSGIDAEQKVTPPANTSYLQPALTEPLEEPFPWLLLLLINGGLLILGGAMLIWFWLK